MSSPLDKKSKVAEIEVDYTTTSLLDQQSVISTRSERKRKPTDGSPRISKRKLTLQETLVKIINSLRQKDTFKFFLNPVDTRQVPDYRLIIKNPMDLGTMKKKVTKKQYQSIGGLQADFELIIANAKIYNTPDTVYYQAAEKLRVDGTKIIEDFSSQLLSVDYDEISVSQVDSPRSTNTKQLKEQKKSGPRKIYEEIENQMFEGLNPDGTIYNGTLLLMKDPAKMPAYEPPKYPSPFIYFAKHYDPNITKCLDIDNLDAFYDWNVDKEEPRTEFTAIESEFYFLTCGDLKGKAYIDSLERFTQGMDLRQLGLTEKISSLTRGAYGIAQAARQAFAITDTFNNQRMVMETEMGVVDIRDRIEYFNGETDRLLQSSESEVYLKLGAKHTSLLIPSQPEPLIQVSPILFELNRTDLARLFNNPNDLSKASTLEMVRQRLFALARYSQDPDLDINKILN